MVVRKIESLLGGSSYFTIDSRWAEKESGSYTYALGDFAIFYRLKTQAEIFEQALNQVGLPYQRLDKKREDEEKLKTLSGGVN